MFDFGSCTTKVGYAGEEIPKHVFPSFVGTENDKKHIGSSDIYTLKPGMEILSPFEDGLISDWDLFESLWEHSYKNALRADSSEHPVMFSDPSWDTKANREKLCEMAFEKFDVPGFYLGRSAVLSAYFHVNIDLRQEELLLW